MTNGVLVLSTLPKTQAADIAKTLVGEKLAACVNLAEVASIYVWQGKLNEDAEVLALIKTTTAQSAALQARLKALHPYELPEIIALSISDGLPAYLAWLTQQTKPER